MLKKEFLIIFLAMLLMPAFFVFRPLVEAMFPDMDSYSTTLLRKALGSISVVIFITALRLWRQVGAFSLRLDKGAFVLLPMAVISFIPLLNGTDISSAKVLVTNIGICLLIGFLEELIFRGVILSTFAHRGRKTAVLLSSALFATTHLLNLIVGADILSTFVQCVFAFGFGLVASSYMLYSGNLLPIIIVHSLWDFNMRIADTNFTDTVDIIHSFGLALVVLWGIFLLFTRCMNKALKPEIYPDTKEAVSK